MLLLRFIPAGAGNTPAALSTSIITAVYPRWRGEHGQDYNKPARTDGLSPLARGTLRMTFPFRVNWRFIPAGAGNTPA